MSDLVKRGDVLRILDDRWQWLTKEAHSGGDWEHLKTRRDEAGYLRGKIAALPSEPAPEVGTGSGSANGKG